MVWLLWDLQPAFEMKFADILAQFLQYHACQCLESATCTLFFYLGGQSIFNFGVTQALKLGLNLCIWMTVWHFSYERH